MGSIFILKNDLTVYDCTKLFCFNHRNKKMFFKLFLEFKNTENKKYVGFFFSDRGGFFLLDMLV